MNENLWLAGLLAIVDYAHGIEARSAMMGAVAHRDQLLTDYYTKAWGGVPGMTPRADAAMQQRERAVLPWLQAVAAFATRAERNRR